VPIAASFSGFAKRCMCLSVALGCLTSHSFNVMAQTAPQLLPYTVKLIAGGATANPAAGTTCPVSGLKSTDAFGDGCLATEILIAPTSTAGTGARFSVEDKTGAVFFSDATNGLVRRIDPITGVVTAVAGGAPSSPASGVACGSLVSTSSNGDGCLGTAVKLTKPMGLVFSPTGDLYFADNGLDNVRKIAATGGAIATTGVITNVVGGSTFGYNVNNTSKTGPVNAAAQGLLNFPYGLALDAAGNNLYIADEGNNAIEVVNLTAATETIQGLSVPAGTIAKFSGYGNLGATAATSSATSGDCPDFTAAVSGQRGGCYFGKWVDGAVANISNNDGVYSLAVDASNNVYFGNEFNNDVGFISAANIISNYAGIQGTAAKDITKRGLAKSFGVGSIFGIALDALNNLYISDASSGVIWRVDGSGKTMYLIGGGAAAGAVCAGAIDALGDGCPATQATFGRSGTTNFASPTLPGPGIFGISVDGNADLFFGDTETGLIREVASGTQFGNVGAVQTDIVDVHFAANDSAATGGYTITAGGTIFSLGSPSCTTNSDLTTDCLLPVTATPATLGPFIGTLQVQAQLGGTGTFSLTGNFIQSPVTRTVIAATNTTACSGSSVVATTAATTLTATLTANGPAAPTGNIIFLANGTPIAPTSGVPVGNIGTSGAPKYGATLSFIFSTPGTYNVTAVYSGNSYFKTSTTTTPAAVTTALPAFTVAIVPAQQGTVSAGQTALYSFNIAQIVYTGTISFAVSGLPANSSAVFSPSTITATGCSTTNTVALSIVTQQGSTVLQTAASIGGKGICGGLATLIGMVLALAIGLRRRRAPLRYGQYWMALALLLITSGTVACGNGVTTAPRTPAGSYTITVTATGSTGSPSIVTVPLTVLQ
jgi:Bacterial Ig-like domain (group 3)